MIAVFLRQVLYLNAFKQLSGRLKSFSVELSGWWPAARVGKEFTHGRTKDIKFTIYTAREFGQDSKGETVHLPREGGEGPQL